MYRVISAFRLIPTVGHRCGPLRPSSDGLVPTEAVGDFLDAIYIVVEKMRSFGFSDDDFGGDIEIAQRCIGEKANGRYFPEKDKSVIFYPPVRGAPDWPWTIIHELAHRLWVKHLSDDQKRFWETLCKVSGKPIDASAADSLARMVQTQPDKFSLWFYFNKHFGDDLKGFKSWLQTKTVSSAFPSRYASSEPSEAFSEVAANVILGRGHSGHEINRTGSMVRKVFLCLVEPLRHKDSLHLQSETMESGLPDENFLQVQLDLGHLSTLIERWLAKNVPENNIIQRELRPHVTVYYGADRRDLPSIQKIITDYGRPIRVMLGELGLFEHEDKDVLYIKIVGDALPSIHKEISLLPHTRPSTYKDYKPHLTIAYLKKGTGRKFIDISPFNMVAMTYSVTIIDSTGVELNIATTHQEFPERSPLLLATTLE